MDQPATDLTTRHADAEARVAPFAYAPPEELAGARGSTQLASTDLFRSRVVVLKPGQGENNLHFHTSSDSFWMVLRGKVKFYGPGDALIGEFGPTQGITTPRFARYWFANSGDTELEMLHVTVYATPGKDQKTGRTDAAPRKAYTPHSAEQFDARDGKR